MQFRDRHDAGRLLAARLAGSAWQRPAVLALPRGGVPVAAPIAESLRAPLDVLVARKVGAPGRRELAIGAIAEGGTLVADEAALRMLSLSHGQFDRLAERERVELERRVRDYRGDRALPDLRDRDVVVVDDGLATGLTAEAALCSLRFHRPRRIILAVPVCSAAAVRRLAAVADEVVRLSQPASFIAVGQWYDDFSQTTDADVRRLVQAASHATETQP